ncbi:MAG: GIY-YIG nuclease family protein [Patescibacteria group bacterium]|jgi:putative endonuclease|nr:GIY-YIG nuclease family protein [Patescibacteria group bacterium]
MPHYVYILYSESFGRYYVGSCINIDQRLDRHNAGATSSTKPYRPWVVVYSEEYSTKGEAIKRELQIKKKKSRKYIEWLLGR